LESVEFADAITLPVHGLDVHSWLAKWESLDSLHGGPILLDLHVAYEHLSGDESSGGGLGIFFVAPQGKVSDGLIW